MRGSAIQRKHRDPTRVPGQDRIRWVQQELLEECPETYSPWMSLKALELADVFEARVKMQLKPRKPVRRSSAEPEEFPFRVEISKVGHT